MPDQSVELASLLCSRLCHDLVNPVGALRNGLELLADTDEADRASSMELLTNGVETSINKLQFFRLAFGAGAAFGDDISAAEVRAAIEGLIADKKRITLGWLVEQGGLGRVRAKVLMNLALIAADAMVRGGQLDIAAEGLEVVVRAEGGRLVLDPEIRAVLAGDAGDAAPVERTAPAWLARRLAADAGGELRLADGEAGVLILAAALPG